MKSLTSDPLGTPHLSTSSIPPRNPIEIRGSRRNAGTSGWVQMSISCMKQDCPPNRAVLLCDLEPGLEFTGLGKHGPPEASDIPGTTEPKPRQGMCSKRNCNTFIFTSTLTLYRRNRPPGRPSRAAWGGPRKVECGWRLISEVDILKRNWPPSRAHLVCPCYACACGTTTESITAKQ